MLTFASIGYFLKNLDQSNVNNAFLSGMKEDLNMYGNQLVTSVSIWTVGYVIGQIPSNLLLTRISPRWVIPSLEVGWGIATICTASVKSYRALYAMRFLVGLFEYVSPLVASVSAPLRPRHSLRSQVRLLSWYPLHVRLLVHAPGDWQTCHDLLVGWHHWFALQWLPPSCCLHQPARSAWLCWM